MKPLAKFARDARRGVVVTGKLLAEVGRHPWGGESARWRDWLFPGIVAVFAVGPVVGALAGSYRWIDALLQSAALGVVSMWLLGRLARRYDRNPDAYKFSKNNS